jgi:hypothetical protein
MSRSTSITRSLARPNYFQLAPDQLILEEDREIERGNPDLKLTTAWNADVMYERYLQSAHETFDREAGK